MNGPINSNAQHKHIQSNLPTFFPFVTRYTWTVWVFGTFCMWLAKAEYNVNVLVDYHCCRGPEIWQKRQMCWELLTKFPEWMIIFINHLNSKIISNESLIKHWYCSCDPNHIIDFIKWTFFYPNSFKTVQWNIFGVCIPKSIYG